MVIYIKKIKFFFFSYSPKTFYFLYMKQSFQMTMSSKLHKNKFSSVQFICSVVSDSLRPHELQHVRPPCPSPTPGVHSNSRPSSRWCHPAISSSVVPFSSCPQPLPALESFPMSQFFSWGGQSVGVSALASVLPMNIQDWFPLGCYIPLKIVVWLFLICDLSLFPDKKCDVNGISWKSR